MTSKWTTQTLPSEGVPLAEQFVVLLLYGKNNFGDKIYSFVKIYLPNIQRLKEAIREGRGFTPSDFGEVIAAGKGEPPSEVRNEIAATYKILDSASGQKPAAPMAAAAPAQKKNWDEY
jgi:hypothetical protein